MGENGEGYAHSVRLSAWSLEEKEEQCHQLVRMERKVELATVLFMTSLIKSVPVGLPAMSFNVVENMIKVYHPPGQETGESSGFRTIGSIICQPQPCGSDNVAECAHIFLGSFQLLKRAVTDIRSTIRGVGHSFVALRYIPRIRKTSHPSSRHNHLFDAESIDAGMSF